MIFKKAAKHLVQETKVEIVNSAKPLYTALAFFTMAWAIISDIHPPKLKDTTTNITVINNYYDSERRKTL